MYNSLKEKNLTAKQLSMVYILYTQYGVYVIYSVWCICNHSTENQIRNLYKKLTFTKVETTQV